ncbi:hypothetical protein [Streptomyces sp. NPDC020571]
MAQHPARDLTEGPPKPQLPLVGQPTVCVVGREGTRPELAV